MGSPTAGTVVLVPFPFSDLSQSKLRPALVLADAGRGDWVLCQITSNPYADPRAVALDEPDFEAGSLRLKSYIRPGKIFTASESLMTSQEGRLKPESLARAVEAVIALLRKAPGVMNQRELTFIVSKVFPTATRKEEEKSASLLRFLLAVRPLYFLQRAVARIPADSPTKADDYNIALSMTIGALKEATDAFRHTLTQHSFDEFFVPESLEGLLDHERDHILNAYEYLKGECGESRGVLLATIVKPMRDDAGFHWSLERIKSVLNSLGDERYVFRQGGSTRQESSFPFLADFVDQLRGSVMRDGSDLAEIQDQLSTLWGALVVVADHLFCVRVLRAVG